MKLIVLILLIIGNTWFARGYDDLKTHKESVGIVGMILGTIINIIGTLLLFFKI